MKMENDLGNDDIRLLVFRIAIPSMLAQFVNVLYSIVDRMFVGNIPEVGELALAGAGICGPIVTLLSSFATWIGIGGAPLLSIKLGENNEKEAKQILANCFIMLSVLAVILTGFFLITKDRLLLIFGASEATFPYANDYLTVYVIGTIFAILSLGLNQFIIAQGYAKKGMFSVILGAVCNIILDPIFIFGFGMGVKGTAIATVISQLASFLYVITFLCGKKVPIPITFQGYSFKVMKRVLIMGASPFLIIATDSLLIIAMNATLQKYGGVTQGDMLITCATIVQSFMLLITMPMGGITGGTQSILGYNYGAKKTDRIKKGQVYILALCVTFTVIMLFIAHLFSPYFVKIFTNNTEYINLSVWAIKISTLGIVPLAFQYAFVDGFTAMGLPRYAMPLSLSRKMAYFSLMLILPAFFSAKSVFYAEPIVDIICGTISTITYLFLINKILEKRLVTDDIN
ncbi:MAG: MATE family efflux transporter [Lachnospiraceae bacterium]